MDFVDRQRRVRRSPLLFVVPLVLLVLLTLVLLWETVRSNVTGGAGREWPWRLRLMDMNPLGSLLAGALAAVFGRGHRRPYGLRRRMGQADQARRRARRHGRTPAHQEGVQALHRGR